MLIGRLICASEDIGKGPDNIVMVTIKHDNYTYIYNIHTNIRYEFDHCIFCYYDGTLAGV